ncbi:OLC1v1005429C1 [Oldenlandia corymbosa var. corymbosa]|uniref:OLC1v1005429C1 n=1 Tax=Oldenlandia corymbosa var. corymbosa TaxID=529605 RepID=A0AAV1DI07_OLDCO|nr:OLC1v1005429C1 [Oldenlandia corymbosa var. corymbosa]
MARRRTRGKGVMKDQEGETGIESSKHSPIELGENQLEKADLQIGESSSRVRSRVHVEQLVTEKGEPQGDEHLRIQAKKLSEILGLNPSRKLEWPSSKEAAKASCWGLDTVKKLKKGGVSLDYIIPKEKDGIPVAML